MKPTNQAKSIVQPIKYRQATPEELERLKKLKPPTDVHGRPLKKATMLKE